VKKEKGVTNRQERYSGLIMEESTSMISFCSYVEMKALKDTSQFERLRNRMGWQKNSIVLYWRR